MKSIFFYWTMIQTSPGKKFDEAKLKELAQSIKVHGIMQPIIVYKTKEDIRSLRESAGSAPPNWRALARCRSSFASWIKRNF